MNEAITIIQETPIMVYSSLSKLFLIFIIVFIFIAFICTITHHSTSGTTFSLIAILLMISLIFIPEIDTGKKQYIIRVNDSTLNLNEFLDKYVIVKHERYSNIYTVREL